MSEKLFLDDIIADPARYFRKPSDVVQGRCFTATEKLLILAAWGQSIDSHALPGRREGKKGKLGTLH